MSSPSSKYRSSFEDQIANALYVLWLQGYASDGAVRQLKKDMGIRLSVHRVHEQFCKWQEEKEANETE